MTAALADWSDSFFETPEPDSLDGGTTSAGPLWHIASSRWGHSMHTMCSYHGMFPARVAHYFIQCYSKPGDLVADPFSGRGTVPLQARVEGRRTICNDLNPLGYVLSRAKACSPAWDAATALLDTLEAGYRAGDEPEPDESEDIAMLFSQGTLKQLCYLRRYLLRRRLEEWSPEELMIAGSLAGIMHGAHRRDGSSQYLSISMPNTFSMSPSYVKKFIREKNLVPPDQDVFERVRDKMARLYLDSIDGPVGKAYAKDAAKFLTDKTIRPHSADLVVTSPPYLRVVNYGTANWIRLWLLGVDSVGREQGEGRRLINQSLDHRHTYASYKNFMLRILVGIERSLKPDGVAAVIIGDVVEPGKGRVHLAQQTWDEVGDQTGLHLAGLVEDHVPVEKKVSRIWGDTRGHATDKDCVLVLTRQGAEISDLRSDVDWEEPYKEGGPDAAHSRVAAISNNW